MGEQAKALMSEYIIVNPPNYGLPLTASFYNIYKWIVVAFVVRF